MPSAMLAMVQAAIPEAARGVVADVMPDAVLEAVRG